MPPPQRMSDAGGAREGHAGPKDTDFCHSHVLTSPQRSRKIIHLYTTSAGKLEVLAFFRFFGYFKQYPVWSVLESRLDGLSPKCRANWAKREKPRRNHRRLQVGKKTTMTHIGIPPKKQPRVSLRLKKWMGCNQPWILFAAILFLGTFFQRFFFKLRESLDRQ